MNNIEMKKKWIFWILSTLILAIVWFSAKNLMTSASESILVVDEYLSGFIKKIDLLNETEDEIGHQSDEEDLSDNITTRGLIPGNLEDLNLLSSTSANKNTIRIYSAADSEALMVETTKDFITYSGDNHNIYYEIDSQSVITVNRSSGSTSRSFYIELHNSEPVTIKQYNFINNVGQTTAETHISAVADRPILNIINEAEEALRWSYTLNMSGAATIRAYSGTGYALRQYETSGGEISLDNNFSLEISGAGGIEMGAALNMKGNSSLVLHDIMNINETTPILKVGAVTVNAGELKLNNLSSIAGDIMTATALNLTNAKMSLSNSISERNGNGITVSGAITLNNASMSIDKVLVADGQLVYGAGALSGIGTTTTIEITESKAFGSGLYLNGQVSAVNTIFYGRDNVIDEYLLNFAAGSSSANIDGCQFDLNLGSSTGGGIFFGTGAATTLTSSKIKISGYINEKPLLHSVSDFVLGRTGNSYTHTGTTIELYPNEDSLADGIELKSLTMHQESSVKIESQSQSGRNMVVSGNVTMNNKSWMYHTSALEGKAGDIGLIGDENEGSGDDENPEEDDETLEDDEEEEVPPEEEEEEATEEDDSEEEEEEDVIIANPELNQYLEDTKGIVYIKGNLVLNSADNFVEVYGNADRVQQDSKTTPYGLILLGADSKIENGGYLKVDNVQIGLLTQSLQLDYSGGDKEYDSMNTIMENSGKSRVYARGTYVGLICTNYINVIRSSNLYSEGGSAGLMVRRTESKNYTAGMRKGTTIIARGMNAESAGLVITEDVCLYSGMRVIAEGDRHGIRLTEKASRIYLFRAPQVIAVGRSQISAGIYFKHGNSGKGIIRIAEGGDFYSFGGMYGIYGENVDIITRGLSSAATALVAIGGIPEESLSHTFASIDYLNQNFLIADLPYPVLSEGNRGEPIHDESEIVVPGIIINGRDGSAGIVISGSLKPYLRARRNSTVTGIGGQYGIANSSEVINTDKAITGGDIYANYGHIVGHGGSIGILSRTQSRVVASSAGGGLWGYGADYGIYIHTTLRTSGTSAGPAYVYGVGKNNGVFSKNGYVAATYSQIIGETWIDGTGQRNIGMAGAAVDLRNASGLMNLATGSILHEIYNAIQLVFASPDPYQLNAEFEAVAVNMGSNAEEIVKYNWTTPEGGLPPQANWNERLYLNNTGKDQRFLYGGKALSNEGKEQYGLIAATSQKDMTVVARRTSLSNSSNASGAVYGNGTHQVTFRNVSAINAQTMKVQIDLREIIGSNDYNIQNLPEGLSFELDFMPEWSIGYHQADLPVTFTIDDTDDYHYDRESGVLTFYKLRSGEYRLKAVNQYGWPYQQLPEIPFVIVTDTRNDANGPGGLSATWTNDKWVEKVYLGYYEQQSDDTRKWKDLGGSVAKLSKDRQQLSVADDSKATFIPTNEDYHILFDKPSSYLSEIQVYYYRIQYEVDIRVVDSQNFQTIGRGTFEYVGLLDDGSDTEVVGRRTFSNSSTNYVAEDAYGLQTMYAGLIYRIGQSRTWSANNYTYQADSHDIRLMYHTELDEHYVMSFEEANFNNQYYSYTTENQAVLYHILACNDWGGNQQRIEIRLVDANDLAHLLAAGSFELYSKWDRNSDYYKDHSLVTNGDGTFTFSGRVGAAYYLYQTGTNVGYQIHQGYYVFDLGSKYIVNATDAGHLVELIEGITGWEEPANKGNPPIIISNQNQYGELEVKINAKGTWAGHGDGIFIVELQRIVTGGVGSKLYHSIPIPGNPEFDNYGYQSQIKSATILIEDIVKGDYQVTVYASLRTGKGKPKSQTGVAARKGSGAILEFDFENQSDQFFSDTDLITHEYVVQFDETG